MRRIATFAVLVVLSMTASADEFRLKHVRPSSVITWLVEGQVQSNNLPSPKPSDRGKARIGRLEGSDRGLVPKGVTLIAKDSAGILEVQGTKDQIAELKRFVDLLDIPPMQVQLDVDLSCPTLSAANSTRTTLYNNKAWQMREERFEIELTLLPRVNEDGTITITLQTLATDGTVQKAVVRLKQNEVLHVRMAELASFAVGKAGEKAPDWTKLAPESDKKASDWDEPEVFVKIGARVVESSGEKIGTR